MEGELPIFFEHQNDKIANHMAAFTAEDPSNWSKYLEHWSRILADDNIIKQTIMLETHVVGHVLSFVMFNERHVSYWIDREHWGKGIATNALKQFLTLVTIRPLFARVAKDNIGSRLVLEKCGFIITGEDSGFANGRGAEIEEYIFSLK